MRLPSNTRHVVCYISKKGIGLPIMIMVTVVGLWDVFVIFFVIVIVFVIVVVLRL